MAALKQQQRQACQVSNAFWQAADAVASPESELLQAGEFAN
jgi:hypothetical protein